MTHLRGVEQRDSHIGRQGDHHLVSPPHRVLRSILATAAWLVVFAALASSAWPSEPIESFSTTTSTPQAGGHPDLITSFKLEKPGEPEAAKNVIFNTPAGVFANPYAITQCVPADFALDQCPSNSQAGLITIYANYMGNPNYLLGTAPVYDLVPGAEETALFSFIIPTLNIPIKVPVTVRTASDYGLRFTVSEITELAPLAGAKLSLWGLPSEEVHSPERFPKGSPGEPSNCPGLADTGCLGGSVMASIPVEPLTDNPTTCRGESLSTTLEVQTYQDPGSVSQYEASYPAITGCGELAFNAALYASLSTAATNSPTGLSLDLSDPQQLNPTVPDPSELKDVAVELPAGLRFNPAAAGLGVCTDAQANLGSDGPASCPENSKIGTLAIGSPSLSGPLEGAVYSGEPGPGDQRRLLLIATGFGINAKLVASLIPDPISGQLAIAFANLPPVPFDEFHLDLSASEPALFVTPDLCGTYLVKGSFIPWDSSLGEEVSSQDVGIDSGPHGAPCPGPAASLAVSLSPKSILANGASTTEATASVTDAEGNPIPGDELQFSSSDPGEQIGPATDNGDGTYTAQITSSKTAGTPTVTATDSSVSPAVSGHATLTQTAGSAAQVAVSLSPTSILANASSTTTATARVTDANGNPVPGAGIAFSSTDSGERIGAVTDNGDGTYTAQITSSTTVGSPTVTATDSSVTPSIKGSAALTQTAGPTESLAPPVATLTEKPPRRTRDRTPTFRFASSESGSTFSCKVDRRPYRPCTSPDTLAKLASGKHTFIVRADGPTGNVGGAAIYKFVVDGAGRTSTNSRRGRLRPSAATASQTYVSGRWEPA